MTHGDRASASPVARVLGRVAWHPVLLAVHPALALWAANVREVMPGETWDTIWQPVAVTGVVWAVLALVLRSWRRGGLVAGVGAVAFLHGGRFSEGEPGLMAVLVALVLVVVTLLAAWRLADRVVAPVTAIANVVGVVLVAATLPALIGTWAPWRTGPDVHVVMDPGVAPGEGPRRDIWYIIPDRYPRQDTLADLFDHDNGPMVSWLEERGFQVADASLANYPKTAHSLAATWNLMPVPELVPDPPADGADWQPLYQLLRDHALGHIVTEAGYEYTHLGSWWSPTSTAASADVVLRVDTASEFRGVWRSLTLLPAIWDTESEEAPGGLSLRERNRRYSAYQLDQLDRLARVRSDEPRFILAHVTLPHEPYVFDTDGSLVTQEQERARTREDNIVRQLTYLNTRLQRLIGTLLSGPPSTWPVIVIQSDEGPHPAARRGPSFDWLAASDDDLREKLATFSAILLPESDVVVPDDLTGVNTWRLVLDATIGTTFGLLDDQPIEVFQTESSLYELYDVSDRVR